MYKTTQLLHGQRTRGTLELAEIAEIAEIYETWIARNGATQDLRDLIDERVARALTELGVERVGLRQATRHFSIYVGSVIHWCKLEAYGFELLCSEGKGR